MPVVVIGLDGATMRVLGPFIKAGALKNLASLMNDGAYGDLLTAIPPLTAPGWPSFLTGKNPGGHGVYCFRDLTKPGYSHPIIDADSIKSRTFFELAAESGRRVCVVNFPMTYPIRRMDGIWVSGFLTPRDAKDYFSPPDIEGLLDDFPLQDSPRPKGEVGVTDALEFLDGLSSFMRRRADTILKLAKRERWDLFAFCLAEPDRIHHFLWKFIDPEAPGYSDEGAERVRARILGVYNEVDSAVGRVMEVFGPDATYIAGSDHGFRRTAETNFHANRMLMEMGVLKSNVSSFKRLLYKNRLLSLKEGETEFDSPYSSPIDWTKTKAWCLSYQCGMGAVFVNLKDRYPYGIVTDGEYEGLLERITARLLEIRHDGRQVVERVYRREELYSGGFAKDAPDLTIRMAEGYEIPLSYRKDLMSKTLFMPNPDARLRSGSHEERGVYILSGANIKKSGLSGDAKIEDIAPTALYLLGVPIPEDMDGKALTEHIDERFVGSHAEARSDARDFTPEERDGAQTEDEMIEAQLKGLGYI